LKGFSCSPSTKERNDHANPAARVPAPVVALDHFRRGVSLQIDWTKIVAQQSTDGNVALLLIIADRTRGCNRNQLVSRSRDKRQCGRLNEIQTVRDFGEKPSLDDAELSIGVVGLREHLVADRETDDIGPDLKDGPRQVPSEHAWKTDRLGEPMTDLNSLALFATPEDGRIKNVSGAALFVKYGPAQKRENSQRGRAPRRAIEEPFLVRGQHIKLVTPPYCNGGPGAVSYGGGPDEAPRLPRASARACP
jgi:hypothetical protein